MFYTSVLTVKTLLDFFPKRVLPGDPFCTLTCTDCLCTFGAFTRNLAKHLIPDMKYRIYSGITR